MKAKKSNKKKMKTSFKWVIKAFILTFILTIFFSLITEQLLKSISLPWAFFLLIMIVTIGITFDAIGLAVASSIEKPFHAMASQRILEARYAVWLIKNADVVANVCNDVIGDICGIISGAAGTIIVSTILIQNNQLSPLLISILLSGMIAAFTVGGKALGKTIAMKKNHAITYTAAKFLCAVDSKLGFRLIGDKRLRRLK